MSDATPGAARSTAHGLTVIGVLVMLCVVLTAVGDALGLRWAEPQRWPTDLQAFASLPMATRPAVVILGSSRASMGLIPSALEGCGAPASTEAGQVYNLGRAYSTVMEFADLAEHLLVPPRTPTTLMVALDIEAIDENNPYRAGAIRGLHPLSGVVSALGAARSLPDGLAALRTLSRGPESLVRVATGRHRADPRLGWLMRTQGGGQWCTGSPACEEQNLAFKMLMADSWQRVEREVLPQWRSAQTPRWAPGGRRIAAAWLRLQQWAARHDVRLVVVEMPTSAEWKAAVPADVAADYALWVQRHVVDAGIALYRDPAGRRSRRADWLDPDHLSDLGAVGFSRRVCTALLQPQRPAGG